MLVTQVNSVFDVFLDSMSRHNSVSNMLKRFFSREDKPESKAESNELNNLISSGDSVSKGTGIKKITDQVIEEVSHNFNPIDCANLLRFLFAG